MNSLNGGYAMIKYNSTQEELQIAYRSKKPVLCYDENRRAHWAVIEEKATESVDEETQEPITIYEYSYRLLDEASGGKLYRHSITLKGYNLTFDTMDIQIRLDILLSTNEALTFDGVRNWLYNNEYTAQKIFSVLSAESPAPQTGIDIHIVIGLYANAFNIFTIIQYVAGAKIGQISSCVINSSNRTCTDVITQIL